MAHKRNITTSTSPLLTHWWEKAGDKSHAVCQI